MAVHMHKHITVHTQHMLASTWLGDHQGRPSAPLDRPSKRLNMERQQMITITITMTKHRQILINE